MRLTEKIRRGWDVSAKGFSDLVQEDFREENRLAWLEVILEGQEGGAPPRILDVGTGPGFFAAILAGEGFSVTGIDIRQRAGIYADGQRGAGFSGGEL